VPHYPDYHYHRCRWEHRHLHRQRYRKRRPQRRLTLDQQFRMHRQCKRSKIETKTELFWSRWIPPRSRTPIRVACLVSHQPAPGKPFCPITPPATNCVECPKPQTWSEFILNHRPGQGAYEQVSIYAAVENGRFSITSADHEPFVGTTPGGKILAGNKIEPAPLTSEKIC